MAYELLQLENTLKVRLEIMLNYEVEKLILPYADSVVNIKPIKLVTLIKTRLKAALEIY